MTDKLSLIILNLISYEQKGFIKRRRKVDCICLTSETINMFHKKYFDGNLALKISIRKAFEILDREFSLKVMHKFGFSIQIFS